MILLVTPSQRALECIATLKNATGEDVVVAESLARATTLLRASSFGAVILDQFLLETNPHEADTMLDHADTAIPVEVNLAICGLDRLAREVRRAIQRRQREEANARLAAIHKLYARLNSTITALLLSIELAVQTDASSSLAFEKLDSIHQLVKTLRQQLEIDEPLEQNHQRAFVVCDMPHSVRS